jgi:hypothetical protein
VPAEPDGVGQQRGEPLNLAQDGDVIDLDARLGRQARQRPVRTSRSAGITDRDHDHLRREPKPNEPGLLSTGNETTARAIHRSSVPGLVGWQHNSPSGRRQPCGHFGASHALPSGKLQGTTRVGSSHLKELVSGTPRPSPGRFRYMAGPFLFDIPTAHRHGDMVADKSASTTNLTAVGGGSSSCRLPAGWGRGVAMT